MHLCLKLLSAVIIIFSLLYKKRSGLKINKLAKIYSLLRSIVLMRYFFCKLFYLEIKLEKIVVLSVLITIKKNFGKVVVYVRKIKAILYFSGVNKFTNAFRSKQ